MLIKEKKTRNATRMVTNRTFSPVIGVNLATFYLWRDPSFPWQPFLKARRRSAAATTIHTWSRLDSSEHLVTSRSICSAVTTRRWRVEF
ncbi:hypothetical protein NPIL_548901 [Nephila pilipes]|uniref:Uncharacterized protein n=1 Tax=Nephila pilipes TaxID=299642 RepID=A0A8X6R0I8_NEPPI|nr:hypothetical protein NPIL_548901 [Nephila pilipes]